MSSTVTDPLVVLLICFGAEASTDPCGGDDARDEESQRTSSSVMIRVNLMLARSAGISPHSTSRKYLTTNGMPCFPRRTWWRRPSVSRQDSPNRMSMRRLKVDWVVGSSPWTFVMTW
ncbi:hypothetical protein FB451DRAFT_1261984 [Mycena latifolia]|nr:hypothetical protein FB451DRAFT_1261984 [Mycena latifolia]